MSENKIDLTTVQGQITSDVVGKLEERIRKFKNRMVEIVNEEAAKTLGTSDYHAANLSIPIYEMEKQCGQDKLISVAKIIGVIGTNLFGLVVEEELKKASKEAMEFAAGRSMQFQKRELRYFEGCALTFSTTGSNLHLVQPPKRESAHIHLQH
jgi:hypothetical protein